MQLPGIYVAYGSRLISIVFNNEHLWRWWKRMKVNKKLIMIRNTKNMNIGCQQQHCIWVLATSNLIRIIKIEQAVGSFQNTKLSDHMISRLFLPISERYRWYTSLHCLNTEGCGKGQLIFVCVKYNWFYSLVNSDNVTRLHLILY